MLVLARCDFRRGRQDAAPPTPTVLITFFFVSFSHSAQLSFTLLQVVLSIQDTEQEAMRVSG